MMTKGFNIAVMENESSGLPNRNGLCSTMRSTVVAKELHQRYNDLLDPISLFTPKTKAVNIPAIKLERPITPIDQDVKIAPTTVSDLCQLIQRRIAAKSEVETVSIEAQQELGGIIIADVKMLWEEFKLHSHDRTLTKTENKELNRRMTAYIITVCEKLFLHYLRMVDRVRQRSVYTDEANLSRLKAQLTHDCMKFLNIPAIKREVSTDIKALRKPGEADDGISELENLGKYKPLGSKSMCPGAPFTFNQLINLSRPKKAPKPKLRTIGSDLQEIYDNMPHLHLAQRFKMLLHEDESAEDHKPMQIVAVPNLNLQQAQQIVEVAINKRQQSELSLSKGQSQMLSGETLSLPKQQRYSSTVTSKWKSLLDLYKAPQDEGNKPSIADDLQILSQTSTVDHGYDADPEATLPPLIEAITYDRSNEIKNQQIKKMLKQLEEEEEKVLKKRLQPKKPEHAQPATVSIRLSHRLMARTADVRVSDRQFFDCVYLKIYPAIYDPQEEEVDQEMIQTMDKNLSFEEELHGIYKHLLKTISIDHLVFDDDPIIAPPATDVDLSGCFPSDTLSLRLKYRVINPDLKLLESDFGTERYLSMTKEIEVNSEPKNLFQNDISRQDSNINLDDYLQYVFQEGSDYLGVIYHFYESEDENEEERRELVAQEFKLKQKEEEERAEIRSIKEEFVIGSWNINTIMLGGLGKEPLTEAAQEKIKIQKLLGKRLDLEDIEELQDRLQRIWIILHVPDKERLDMAIKYSSQKHWHQVYMALDSWESAVSLIQERECVLFKLENFERFASDPNRFFEKGHLGTSTVRLKESRKRDKFYSDLTKLENQLSKIIKEIKVSFKDVVTFKGRPYVEKMQRDKVEMLFWLQQERRKCILQKISADEPVTPKGSVLHSCASSDI
ncbi:coiled-coil domain-containing protein 87 [Rhinoraja longicauda]